MPKTAVLAPGLHVFENNFQQRVGVEEFCANVLSAIPEGVFYRKAGVVGRILDGDFAPLVASQARILVDTYCEIELHSLKQKQPHVQFIPCPVDLGQAVLDFLTAAEPDGLGFQLATVGNHKLRLLRAVAPHPVITPMGNILGPGWHPWYGIEVTWSGVEAPEEDPAELFADFGLDRISQANTIALLFTVMARPALNGNVPAFVVTAPVPGAGKTKLVDELVGSLVLGRSVPSMMWPEDGEEVRKTLTAAIMSGSQLLNLDNVPRVLNSSVLASFLTSSAWRDRILGKSQSVEILNTLTLTVTGNSIQASGELARRSVRIVINPGCDNPELRNGWKYPRLREAALRARNGVLAWCLGIFRKWVAAGRPESDTILGSFEVWVRTVVDPLRHAGIPALEDVRSQAAAMDADRRELENVFAEWWARHASVPIYPKDVLEIADAVEAWQSLISSRNNQRGQVTVVGLRLQHLVGRVIGNYRMDMIEGRKGRMYRLATLVDEP